MGTGIFAPPAPAAQRVPGVTDNDLIAAVRAGDDTAFAKLYERYQRRIAAYIYGMVKDYGRAEDIAQDVFVSALRRIRATDRPIAFKPWIYEIAKNACIDQFRRSRRGEEVSYDAEDGLAAADHRRLVTTGPSPDSAVDQKLRLDHLCGAFSGLSQTHHEILVMRELEGLSYREIGERLGMTRPAVESTLFRARRRLAEEYEELVSGERCLRIQASIAAAAASGLGARDRRRMAAHVSHCQPCRRHARVAGIDPALLQRPRPVRAKIAALLPLPLFLRRRWSDGDAGPASATHSATAAQWSTQLSVLGDPGVTGWAKAVAAAATLAVAGVGAGAATQHEVERHVRKPAAVEAGAPGAARAAQPAAVRRVARAAGGSATGVATPTSTTAVPRPGRNSAGGGASAAGRGSTTTSGGARTSAPASPSTTAPISGLLGGGGAPDPGAVTATGRRPKPENLVRKTIKRVGGGGDRTLPASAQPVADTVTDAVSAVEDAAAATGPVGGTVDQVADGLGDIVHGG